MNKFFYLVLAVAMLVSCAGGNRGLVGAYSKPQRLTEEDKALFEAVVTPEFGDLKPRRVSYQVVAGTNYRFECRDSNGKKVFVTVYVPLPGSGL